MHCALPPDKNCQLEIRSLHLLAQGRQVGLVLQGQPHGFNLLRFAVGQVQQGAVFDFAILAIGLTEQDAAMGGLSFLGSGDDLGDIHDFDYS